MAAQKSRYIPRNPQKYKGDPTKIICRSSWERKYCIWLDTSSTVISWSSEEIIIQYKSPITGKRHRYFPDYWVKMHTKNGVKEFIIEIKPKYQTQKPKVQSKKTKRYLNEVKTYVVNKWKWEAALKYCEQRGYTFQILTEDDLGIK